MMLCELMNLIKEDEIIVSRIGDPIAFRRINMKNFTEFEWLGTYGGNQVARINLHVEENLEEETIHVTIY